MGQQTDRQFLQSTLETLRTLAVETDGRAIVNRNDLEAGLKQVVRDSSAYYLLGYNSTNSAADGKFHEIKVRAKRPGAQVRARKGYWSLTKEELARSVAPPPPSAPAAVDQGARLDLGADARPLRPQLDRDRERRERQDARDLRLGAAAGRCRGGAGPGGRCRPAGVEGRPFLLPGLGGARRRRHGRAVGASLAGTAWHSTPTRAR